jgi:hypothetical protein
LGPDKGDSEITRTNRLGSLAKEILVGFSKGKSLQDLSKDTGVDETILNLKVQKLRKLGLLTDGLKLTEKGFVAILEPAPTLIASSRRPITRRGWRRTLLLVTASLLVFMFIFGSFEFVSYTQTSASLTNVRFVGVTLAPLNSATIIRGAISVYSLATSPNAETFAEAVASGIQSVKLNLTFTFLNYGVLPVYVLSETHQVFANGFLAGTGGSSGFWVPAGGTYSMTFSESISTADLVSMLRSAVLSGGQVKFDLVGTANLGVGGYSFSLQSGFDLFSYLSAQTGIAFPK